VYKLGERWIRDDGVYELVRIEDGNYIFARGPRDEIWLNRDLFVVKAGPTGGEWRVTKPPSIDWPLAVGKKGSGTGHLKPLYSSPGTANMSWEVKAYEDVEVPAGKYKAFRMDFTFQVPRPTNFAPARWASSEQSQWNLTAWYAPEIRQLVKTSASEWQLRFEVVAVDPEETSPLRVAIESPAEHDALILGDAELIGKVSGGKGVSRLTVSLNGATVTTEDARGEPRRLMLVKVPLKGLREGKNVVILSATDPTGQTTQEARTVYVTRPVRIDIAQFPGQTLRVDTPHAVVVAKVIEPQGVRWLNLWVNANTLAGTAFGDAREATLESPATLHPGENRIGVAVIMKDGQTRDIERKVVLEKSAPPTAMLTAIPVPSTAVAAAPTPVKPAAPPSVVSRPAPAPAASPPVVPRPSPPPAPSTSPSEKPAPPAVTTQPEKPAAISTAPAVPRPPPATPTPAIGAQPTPPTVPVPGALALPPVVTRPAAEKPALPTAEPKPTPTIVAALPPQPPAPPPPPLAIALTSPREQARLEQESVGLAGIVSGGMGVSRVLITLNGIEISRQEERSPQGSVAMNLPLRLREGQNTLVVTATDAGGTIHQEVRTVHYEKLLPLNVAFRYPADQARVTDVGSVAAAIVTSSKGVARVSVTLNGQEVHQQSERLPQKSVLVTVPLTLREGVNTIALAAIESDGTVRQEIRTVILEKPAVVVAPPPLPAPRVTHDRWAVVIGVGQYEAKAIPGLRYTVSDAEAIYNVLTGPAGFRKEHVLLLTDKTDRKPTYRNIKWALGTFLSRSAKKDDTVLIFFAGHGAPETDPRGLERDGLAKYLIPQDADPDDLYSTALPMDDLQTIFGRIEAERVVAFIDACYSGAAGGRTFSSKKTRAGSIDELFLERLTRSKGRAIITASRTNEVSLELPALGHGIFTYYLVEGLKGAADLNRDGIITLQELYEYVEQHVTQKSRAVGGAQHPVMKGELEGALPLAKVPR